MQANRSCLLLLSVILSIQSIAQCSSTAALNGTSFSDDNSIGSLAFSSIGSASASDNNRSSASAILTILNGNTHYLKATGFNFAIPSSAAICGILLEVEKSASNISILATVTDNSVRLVKDGTITGNNYATATEWNTTDAYFSYGGTTDLWGTTWTPDDINDADFGMAFSAHIIGLITLLPSARIDHVRITVYYNVVLPTQITNFKASAIDDESNMLQWSGHSTNEQAELIIERSTNSTYWESIGVLSAIVNTEKPYQFIDPNAHESVLYYRLQIKYNNGRREYSQVAHVSKTKKISFSFYPNPAKEILHVESSEKLYQLTCIESNGRRYTLNCIRSSDGLYSANISSLSKGTFFIQVNGKKISFIKQ